MKEEAEGTIAYIMKRRSASVDQAFIRIEIPESWKVTYGPLAPFQKGGGTSPLGVRIYAGKDKIRAIIPDVVSFWQEGMDIKVSENGFEWNTLKENAVMNKLEAGPGATLVQTLVVEHGDGSGIPF